MEIGASRKRIEKISLLFGLYGYQFSRKADKISKFLKNRQTK
jgi:hypothetical protein